MAACIPLDNNSVRSPIFLCIGVVFLCTLCHRYIIFDSVMAIYNNERKLYTYFAKTEVSRIFLPAVT
jgi:hypothetical protein